MFTLTGVAHFVGLREELISYVPPMLPEPALLITITGVLELAGAVGLGLVIRRTAPLAAGCLAALMIVMYPANLYAALAGIATDPLSQPIPRTLIQVIFIGAAIAVVITERRAASTTRPAPRVPRPARSAPLVGRRR